MEFFYRQAQGLRVSSLGIGTYLGAMDQATDQGYRQSVSAALLGGINLVDTSLNYRNQRSEQAVGRALVDWGGARDRIVVCTKAGYLVPEAVPGNLRPEDVVGGRHSIAPGFLDDQLSRSLSNLGLHSVDVFYLHNPETQWGQLSEEDFYHRIRAAFEYCEHAFARGRLRYYGIATWDAFRRGEVSVSLRRLESIAREIAGPKHRFRFIQLPVNLAMREALTKPVEPGCTILELAAELGITVIASAALLHARLASSLPDEVADTLAGRTAAQRAIQFARSAPGVSVALVGMSTPEHVSENLELAAIPAAEPADILRLFQS
jgi:aryl-alcohol dehydrogenase-like predicted oxidoreductase